MKKRIRPITETLTLGQSIFLNDVVLQVRCDSREYFLIVDYYPSSGKYALISSQTLPGLTVMLNHYINNTNAGEFDGGWLKKGDVVDINGYSYRVYGGDTYGWFLSMESDIGQENSLCFSGITYLPKEYVAGIVGYDPGDGFFPHVRSLEDLTDVVDQLKAAHKTDASAPLPELCSLTLPLYSEDELHSLIENLRYSEGPLKRLYISALKEEIQINEQ